MVFISQAVDTGVVSEFLTNDSTVISFFATIIVEFISKTVGWIVFSTLWNAGRGISGGTLDPVGLFDFATNPDIAAENIIITIGYALLNVATFAALTPLNVQSSTGRLGEVDTSRDGTDLVLSALDTKFSAQSVGYSTIVNTILAAGFLGFWVIMSLLPNPANQRSTARQAADRKVESVRSFDAAGEVYSMLDRALLFVDAL